MIKGFFPIFLFGLIVLFSGGLLTDDFFASAGGPGQLNVRGVISVVPNFPIIVSLVASDPDGLDAVYSNGDVITVTFDKATNRPPAATKTDLQNLFTFSQNLGADFTGSWTSASVLQITIVDSIGGNPTIGGFSLTVKASGNLRNEQGTSFPSTATSPPLSGDFGNKAGPGITSLVAADPFNDDAIFDAGDTITVRFTENTNQPNVVSKIDLDKIFDYTEGGSPAVLGAAYSGVWTNARTLQITIISPATATVSPSSIGQLTFTVKAAGDLKNQAGTSLPSVAVSPPLSGTFGTAPGPFFTSLVANDPDGGDAVYGAGDTITATFSRATNQPFGPNLIRSDLDTLFTYSQDLGTDYTGFWVDPVTLVITIQDPFGAAPPTVGSLQLTAKASGNLRDQANTSLPSTALSPALSGNFGTKAGPAITSFTVSDPDGLDAVYSNGDVFTITYDGPTNRRPVTTKADLDALFSFSQSLGADYIGTWTTPSILKITVVDRVGGNPTIGVLTATVKASGNLKNQAGTSLASISVSPPLTGDFGKKAGPAFTSLIASDPSNDDAIFDTGDRITARFDVDTNTPPVNSKTALDALFTFSQEIGDDYTGVWVNPKTLRITVLDDTVDTPPRIGELKLIAKASGNLRNAANTSLPSVAVSPALTGTFGTAPGPGFDSIVANDPDGADAVYSNGDIITVVFDKPTNTQPVATKANLDNLFLFSQNLGSDYTGVWADDRTLVITIVDALGATPPKADTNGIDEGELRLTVKAAGNLRNKDNTSLPSIAVSPLLTGNFGEKPGPQILSMVAGDPPPNVPGYSNGDTITITFNERTNRPAAATKTDLNAIFDFSQLLGNNYVGSWQSATVLVITITDSTASTPPAPGVLTATVKLTANLKNEAGTSLASTSISPVLIGNFGLEPGPVFESVTASDPNNDDAIFDNGDIFTLRYDKDTNQPLGPTLDRAEIDSLLVFSQDIGDDYSGEWVNAKTLRITVLDDTVDTPPQIGQLQFTVKNLLLQTADLSSAFSTPVSPPLDGTFGNAPGPIITDYIARDPFGQDAVFGPNDILTVVFDKPTNERFGPTLTKTEIDTLFTFSDSLGNDYTGVWFEPEVLEITIVNPGSANPIIGTSSLQVNAAAGLKNAAGTSLSSTAAAPPLTGDFGTKPGPQIENFEAADPLNIGGLTDGDTLTITFGEATNEPPVSNKEEIDQVFDFTDNVGLDYSGQWFDPRTLIITINEATGGALTIGSSTVTVIGTGPNALKNSANTSLESDSTSLELIGDFGQTAGPAIISLIAHDPDNLDSFFSNGDTLTVIFDTRTSEPPVATKAQIDSLFTFSQTIGDDYTGVWNNVGDLVITVIDGEQLPQAPIIGELQVISKGTGNIQTEDGSLPSTSVSPFVTGSWGNFKQQVPVCEGGEAFSTFPDGKTAEISFAGDECGGFTFEVAGENTSERIEFVGEPVRISPIGDTDCSEPPHCLLAFVFRQNQIPLEDGNPVNPFTRVKILKDVNADEIILQDFDNNGEITQADLDASNEVFNGLPLAGINIGGTIFDTPQTTVIALDDVRFEASATTPSNSKFAIGGIKALAIGGLVKSPSPSPSPSPSAPSSPASGAGGAGGGGGGGNAASLGEEGGFAGAIDTSQVKLYEVEWDRCDKKMLRVIAGPAGPGLSVKAVAAMGGIIQIREAAEQPFSKATVYETPISEIETFIRVQVEGVIGREASLAQRSFDLKECSGGIGGYSETVDSISPELPVPAGSFPSTAALFEDGSMFDTRYNDIDFGVGYWMTEGQITQMDVNEEDKSITFGFSDKIDGRLVLSLPSGMISADEDKFILINPATSQQISFEVIESGTQYVTLEMFLSQEMDSITVIGTTVVPEFGLFTIAILFISILLIMVISKTNLIPKVKL